LPRKIGVGLPLPIVAPRPAKISPHDATVPLVDELDEFAWKLDWKGLTRFLEVTPRPPDLPAAAGQHFDTLGVHAGDLKDLKFIHAQLQEPRTERIPFKDVDACLENLARSPENRSVVAHVRQHFSLRKKLEQLPVETPEDLRSLVRDLTRLGESVGPVPPPAASPLGPLPLPEAEPLSFRPRVADKLKADLPQLKEARAAEVRTRKRVLNEIEANARLHWKGTTNALQHLRHSLPQTDQDEKEKKVEEQIKGKLTDSERLLARRLLQTKSVAEVTAILRKLKAVKN
jgi:hypothetical protein